GPRAADALQLSERADAGGAARRRAAARQHPAPARPAPNEQGRPVREPGVAGGLRRRATPAGDQRQGPAHHPRYSPNDPSRGPAPDSRRLSENVMATDAAPITIPIARPHLPERDRFMDLVADLFDTRMLSNFGKYAW